MTSLRPVLGPTGLGSASATIARPQPRDVAASRTAPPRPTTGPAGGLTTGPAGGLTGLGTAAARAPAGGSQGGVLIPPLYGPGPVRVDEDLGEEVDDRLIAWFGELGIFAGQLDRFRAGRYGRLAMLTHPDADDPDQLMLAARWMAALFAVGDLYCDDEAAGADPALVGPRLALALAALDPPHLLGSHAASIRRALRADPVLIALRSSLDWVARDATPSQLDRVRHETARMFVAMTAEAAWQTAGYVPPVWEYLASRQVNSFLPCITLIDVVGGYELPADVYADSRVHRAAALAASAAVIVNDVYSMAREQAPAVSDFNLPRLIAAEPGCSPQQAVDLSVAYHADVVRAFEAAHRDLLVVVSPALQRYLLGLRAWIGGSRAWHESGRRC